MPFSWLVTAVGWASVGYYFLWPRPFAILYLLASGFCLGMGYFSFLFYRNLVQIPVEPLSDAEKAQIEFEETAVRFEEVMRQRGVDLEREVERSKLH
jgi:hypothetical protein